ncbi:V-type proton ATPase subunit S1-like protein isoform X1 [Trichosurus vulpecula]|uniref:V-type proton ATPase subunit S1-like protein isoform X1 n=2 Tax=Trichosurus vulpecula TaxID=9337 RepID=UPI00186B29E6|nr:V-type proton ATPase subunit S1-like protein isoform X1 [Trichosurus vulpecula]
MERKTSFCFVLIFLSVGFSLTADQMFASMNTSAVSLADQRHDGHMKTTPNFKSKPTPQSINYDLIKKGNLEREPWKTFSPSHLTPINVSINGTPCILFWAKRITIKFKSQPLLDLTDKTFGKEARVDVGHSNCSEENAMLSLKFGDIDNLKGLDIRFVLISYNRLSVQSWFSLHRVQILYNNSVQATFKATRIHAPSKYSYHCQHVSSLQRYDALLVPSSTNDISRLWEVTFIDFQIQGFNVKEGQFSHARDCASFFSPAILMGLAMSLILLLVLAYALHMLIHLKSLDRHYDRKASPAYFVPMKDLEVATEEKEPLRSHGHDCHEPRSPHICNIYV